MKERFRCWRCKDNRRYSRKELTKRAEVNKVFWRIVKYTHVDYCCPKCETVIICCS